MRSESFVTGTFVSRVGIHIQRGLTTSVNAFQKSLLQGHLNSNLSLPKVAPSLVSPMMHYHRVGGLFMPSLCRFGR